MDEAVDQQAPEKRMEPRGRWAHLEPEVTALGSQEEAEKRHEEPETADEPLEKLSLKETAVWAVLIAL